MGGGNEVHRSVTFSALKKTDKSVLWDGDGIDDSLKNPSLICFYDSLAFGIITAAQQVCYGVCCSWRSAEIAGDSSSFHGSNRSVHVFVLLVVQSRCYGEGKSCSYTVTAVIPIISQCFYLCSSSE